MTSRVAAFLGDAPDREVFVASVSGRLPRLEPAESIVDPILSDLEHRGVIVDVDAAYADTARIVSVPVPESLGRLSERDSEPPRLATLLSHHDS